LCSQPTLSRLENSPRLRNVIRLTYTLVDAWMDSYPGEPASITLDIDLRTPESRSPDDADCAAIVAEAKSRWGRIDVLGL
jgi:hypothetical protein